MVGAGFGLPALLHPDEPAYVLQALAVGRGLPDGLTFADPPLYKYLLLAEYATFFGLERVAGVVGSPAEFVDRFRADPSLLYALARVTSAALGALAVIACGWLGGLVGGRRVGVVAALLCAVAFLLVREAHFGVNDSMVTLLVTLGLVFCVRIFERGARRDYLYAGTLSGLAFAAKYDGIALLAPLLVAHALRVARRHAASQALAPTDSARPDENTSLSLGLALVACGLACVVAFPSLVTEPPQVIGDIYLHLYLSATGGYDGLDPSGGYVFYARTLGVALGWPVVAAVLVGIGLAIKRTHWSALVVAVLPLAMLLVLGSQQLYFARFLLPTLPALLVEAAIALDWLLDRQRLVGIVTILVVVTPTLVDSVRFDALLTQTDTRTLAAEWIRANVPPGTNIATDAPPLGPPVADTTPTDVEAIYERSPDEYQRQGIEYLVVSSFVLDARAVDPGREQQRVAFQRALEAETEVARFAPYVGEAEPPFHYDAIYAPYTDLDRLQRPGPTISIYRLTR